MSASEIANERKRRILLDFRLDKISAVDNPCQEGARVAIIKRRGLPDDEIEKPKFPAFGDPAEIKKAFEALQVALDKQTDALAELNAHKENEQQRRQGMHPDPFMTHVARIQKRDNCPRSQALMLAAEEQPEALAEYRSRELPADPQAELIAKRRDERATIDRHVREIMKREGVSRLKAFEMLPDEHPELFEVAPEVS